MTLRIVAVSGGRADYGLLAIPLQRLAADSRFDLRLIVTGQHLVPASQTLAQIAADGLTVHEKVDILLSSDTALAVCKTTGLAVIGIAEALERQAPDLVLLLGDRYEIFAAAFTAHVLRIPIAHIAGGDVTEGAIDDALRHGITKLAHIHLVTTEDAGHRVRQLGEEPRHIHVVGSPGIDRIRLTTVPDRDSFFNEIGFIPRTRNIVITFHPATARGESLVEAQEMLAALHALGPDTGLIFTGVNADTEGRSLEREIRAFCAAHVNANFYDILGARLYFAALTHCDMIVGNSSSGLYEAPSFGIPTVNIGHRQTGRLKPTSVIDCVPRQDAIAAAICRAFLADCSGVINPYGDGWAADRIAEVLANLTDLQGLLNKPFHDYKSQP
jgi:UDP-hydrolysing UDP-N-acetyl-D-glucosamine 2-epimerase